MMKILVANNHLVRTGGTENYTFALAIQLKGFGHDVEYFTFQKGEVSEKMEKLGIPYMSKKRYDLILANHVPIVQKLFTRGFIIQTCHGVVIDLEQPSEFADMHVSVTEEVKDYLKSKGFESRVINNGIDCKRFAPHKPISDKLTTVLSLSQSDELNVFIKGCCDELGVEFLSCNKFTDNVWEVEEMINKSDLVVGIGRSLYDTMACGRCVISFDKRDYINEAIGDGYLNKGNIDKSIYHNCSGRGFRRKFNKQEFIEELKKYNCADGKWAREFALNNLNIEKASQMYVSCYEIFKFNEVKYKKEKKIKMSKTVKWFPYLVAMIVGSLVLIMVWLLFFV